MLEIIEANGLFILIALMIGFAVIYWVWGRSTIKADVQPPKIAPSAPKAVSDLAKTMPAATEPVTLMDTTKPVPKAKVAAKAPTKPAAKADASVAPKAKAVRKGKAAAAAAPKAKPAPVKKAAVPKAKEEVPKAKAAPAAKPKAEPSKVKVAPAAKPKAAAVATPKAAAKPKAAVKPKAPPKAVIPDNLELLKGVGPKLNTLLKSLGVTSFEQIANWSAADVREIDARLGTFAGRISRDNWVDQAKLLVAGDVKGFEKKYGALGSEIQ